MCVLESLTATEVSTVTCLRAHDNISGGPWEISPFYPTLPLYFTSYGFQRANDALRAGYARVL